MTDQTDDTDKASVPATRRMALGMVGGVGIGSVAAFDEFVERALDTDNVSEWILRLSDPLASPTVRAATASDQKAQVRDRQESVVWQVESLGGASVERQFWVADALLVDGDTDPETLRSLDGVTTVHPNFAVDPPEPAGKQRAVPVAEDTGAVTYGLAQVDAPAVWETYDVDGTGARVAILDTGAHAPHQDIDVDGWIALGPDGAVRSTDPGEAFDDDGHGTHVAGTALGNNEGETAIGVAPGAEHYHANVFPEVGEPTSFAVILEAMEWAAEQEADVINMSLGAAGFWPPYVEAVETVTALGTAVVASAGNDGPETSGSPGNVFETTAVGATDEGGDIASFSSGQRVFTPADWGEVDDEAFEAFDPPEHYPTWYTIPDVAAPGDGVESAQARTLDWYTRMSGTSMAAPHATGILALAISAGADPDAPDMRSILTESAVHPIGRPLDADDERIAERELPGIRYGRGVPNAFNAVTRIVEDGLLTGSATLDGEDAATGATVSTAHGSHDVVDSEGRYRLPLPAGDHTVEAATFGFESATPVTVTDETTLDITLDPVLAVSVAETQPVDVAGDSSFQASLDVAHLEALTIEPTLDTDQAAIVGHVSLLGSFVRTQYQVDLTDETGEGVGATPVLDGENHQVGVRLVGEEGTPSDIEEGVEYTATIHVVDEDAVEGPVETGAFHPPGTFPVLPRATADGLDPAGVTDSATPQSTLSFPDQASDSGDTPRVVVEGVADGTVLVTYATQREGEIVEVVAGVESGPFEGEIAVAFEDDEGFPGVFTTHHLPEDEGDVLEEPGDVLSTETADAVTADASATVYEAALDVNVATSDSEVTVELDGEELPLGERIDITAGSGLGGPHDEQAESVPASGVERPLDERGDSAEESALDGPLSGSAVPVTITVTGAPPGAQLALAYALEGPGPDSGLTGTVTTGPTTVLETDATEEPFDIVDPQFDETIGAFPIVNTRPVIENPGGLTTERTVRFQLSGLVDMDGEAFDEDELDFRFPIEFGPKQVEPVSVAIQFNVPLPRQEGTQTIEILDGDDTVEASAAGTLLVDAAEFAITEVDWPEELGRGREFVTRVTVENTGPQPGPADLDLVVDDRVVASVTEDVSAGETVTVRMRTGTDGMAPGTYEVAVVPRPVADEFETPEEIQETVRIVELDGPPQIAPSFDGPPTDLDIGDGLYRDITGDGTFTVVDVQLLFEHLHSDVVTEHAAFFNFSQTSPDRVTVFDVQALFTQLDTYGTES